MMDTSLLSDVVVYSVQVACVVTIGGVLATVVRVDAADVRYFYWRSLLALCLALPWLQVRQTVHPVMAPTPAGPGGFVVGAHCGGGRCGPRFPRQRLTGSPSSDGSSSTGIVIRLAGVGLGFWRLRTTEDRGVPRSAL